MLGLVVVVGGCSSDPPAAVEKTCVTGPAPGTCASGVGADQGLGKPCQSNKDCKGQDMAFCPRQIDPSGLAFCTSNCFGSVAGECGKDGVCVDRGNSPRTCVPKSCEVACNAPFIQVPVPLPCATTQVNALGVGFPCKLHEDCDSRFQVAHECQFAYDEKDPNWCTLFCDNDEECGAEAFCWQHRSEKGQMLFSVCTPKLCIVPGAGK